MPENFPISPFHHFLLFNEHPSNDLRFLCSGSTSTAPAKRGRLDSWIHADYVGDFAANRNDSDAWGLKTSPLRAGCRAALDIPFSDQPYHLLGKQICRYASL